MASSNVRYYEKQKELQYTATRCERQRRDLDRQLRDALCADQVTFKMKLGKLHMYWNKLCEDERQAKQRNEMIIRDLERTDSHMSDLNARTQRLALIKKRYEDYILQAYPKWNELMNNFPPLKKPSADWPQRTSTVHSLLSQENHTEQMIEKQNFKSYSVSAKTRGMEYKTDGRSDIFKLSEKQQHQDQQMHLWQQKLQTPQEDKMLYDQQDLSKKKMETCSGIYANLPSSYKDEDPVQNAVISNSPHGKHHIQQDTISPIADTVKIPYDTSERAAPIADSMQPENDESDSELSLGQSLRNTQIRVGQDSVFENASCKPKLHGSSVPELSTEGLINLLHVAESSMEDVFSSEDYYRTSSFPSANQKNDIVRKANSGENMNHVDISVITLVILEQITIIVQNLPDKCLLPDRLLQNMIDLTADTLRKHLLHEALVIWNALFAHFIKLVKYHIMSPHELADIFTPCLVSNESSQDKGRKFIIQLLEGMVHDINENPAKSGNEISSLGLSLEESESFMEGCNVPSLKFGSLLDKPFSDDDNSSCINYSLPQDPVPLNETAAYKGMISDTGSGRQLQQFSGQDETDDDVEKQIASALAKNSVSQKSPQQKGVPVDDPSEMCSQTVETSHHVYVPSALESRQVMNQSRTTSSKCQGVKISSDLDTDTEVDAWKFGSSRHPEDNNDFDFYD